MSSGPRKTPLLWSSLVFLSSATVAFTSNSSSRQHKQFHSLPLVPHHVQKARRLVAGFDVDDSARRRDEVAQQVGALYQGYGTHYLDLWVGTPPQRQTVIVDTGSGVTAFPCSGCGDCGEGHHIDAYFIEADSSSFHKSDCSECTRGRCEGRGTEASECRIGMSYQEGSSWSAYECADLAYAGGPHDAPLLNDNGGTENIDPMHASAFAFDMVFGCQTRITGLFKTQLADGIMGMDNAETSFWYQMQASGMMSSKQFALCFSRQPTAERSGTEAGALTLGGFDERLHHTPMVYTSNQDYSGGFFAVRLRKVYLRSGGGGDSAKSNNPDTRIVQLDIDETNLNKGNVIVDSGTTDSYFNRHIATVFKAEYQKLTGKAYSHSAVELTQKQLDALPTILFQIAGDEEWNKQQYPDASKVAGLVGNKLDKDHPYDVILALPPSHYMEYDAKQEKYVARFYVDEGSGSVLGANAMMGHDVHFDVGNNRIGWAESDCDYTNLLRDNGFAMDVSEKTQESMETDVHEADTPEDDIQQPSKVHPAIDACNDLTCRGIVVGALLGALVVGLFIGRLVSNNRRQAAVRYQATEVAMSTLNFNEDDDDDEGFGGYRDHPMDGEVDDDDDDDVVATEGTGYKNEQVPPGIA